MAEDHPGIKEARQAKEETRQAKMTSSAGFGPAHLLTMSDQQWKFKQSRDTLCKEMKQYVNNNRLSSIPEVKNVISLYLPTPCPPSTPILVQLTNSGRPKYVSLHQGPKDDFTQRLHLDLINRSAINILNDLNNSPAVEAISPIRGSRHDHSF